MGELTFQNHLIKTLCEVSEQTSMWLPGAWSSGKQGPATGESDPLSSPYLKLSKNIQIIRSVILFSYILLSSPYLKLSKTI